jgi:hypothetical protein
MASACATVPSFDRLNYYYGQLLGAGDFLAEQRYFREKLKLHNRCLHGYGVVCGLEVLVPPPATPPVTTPALQVSCGLAIDRDGNELVVRDPIDIPDVTALLSAAERAALPTTGSGVSVWITLCYHERGIEPNRPVLPDACGAAADCLFGKTREQVCVGATTTAPIPDTRCATCCEPPPDDRCVTLARIDAVLAGQSAVAASSIHNEARRMLGTHAATTVSGIGWTHGGSYGVADARRLLAIGANPLGLVFQFSAPVHVAETAPQGIVDAWLLKPSGAVVGVPGKLTWAPAPPPAPAGTALSVTFGSSAPAAVQPEPGDRVHVTLRSAFILDTCCRPVDGAHVGGRVPALPSALVDANVPPPTTCASPPGRFGGWTSGGGGAASFESWFFVR